jgi:hypothetical protein
MVPIMIKRFIFFILSFLPYFFFPFSHIRGYPRHP